MWQATLNERKLVLEGNHFHFYNYGRKGTLPKTNGLPLKIGRDLKGNEKVFQPSIFRCELSVSERVYKLWVDECQCPIFLRGGEGEIYRKRMCHVAELFLA